MQTQTHSVPCDFCSFRDFHRGNQVNVNVEEGLDREAELGSHSPRSVYSVFKVTVTAFFHLPCAGEELK